jgi:GT2 family glycosyltransferase
LELGNSLIWGSSASIVIYHKPTLLKVGLFDERFFAYEEDVDQAYRLNKAGFKTLFVPSATSYHLGGGTSSKMGNFRQQMDFKNWILFIAKNYSFKEIMANSPSIFIERFRNLSGVIKSTPPHLIPSTIFSIFYKTIKTLK